MTSLGRRLVLHGIAVLILGASIAWAVLIQSGTLCPSCPPQPYGPCSCITNNRIPLRVVIVAGGLLLALVVARFARPAARVAVDR